VSSDFHCIANHLEVPEHVHQVLLCKDWHVWEILYLKIIIGLVIIMSINDVLETSESHEAVFLTHTFPGQEVHRSLVVILYMYFNNFSFIKNKIKMKLKDTS